MTYEEREKYRELHDDGYDEHEDERYNFKVENLSASIKIDLRIKFNQFMTDDLLDQCYIEIGDEIENFLNNDEIKQELLLDEAVDLEIWDDYEDDEGNHFFEMSIIVSLPVTVEDVPEEIPATYYDPPEFHEGTLSVYIKDWNNSKYKFELESRLKKLKIGKYITNVIKFQIDLSNLEKAVKFLEKEYSSEVIFISDTNQNGSFNIKDVI